MKIRILILAVCISLTAVAALAHNGEEHVIGTVANVAQDSITVNTTANKVVTVAVVPQTKFIRDKVGVTIGDLKTGDRVVIHAKEPAEGKLVADTVEFAGAKPAQTGAASSPQSNAQTLTGIVSDSTCGATHTMKNMSAADCTSMCIKMGRKYVLVVGPDVYALRGHELELQRLAGMNITVKGSVNGKNVTVDSVIAQRQS